MKHAEARTKRVLILWCVYVLPVVGPVEVLRNS